MKWDLKRFFIGWTIIYFLTIATWFVGHHAFFAANKTNWQEYGLNFALSLGGGASFILALIFGLIIPAGGRLSHGYGGQDRWCRRRRR